MIENPQEHFESKSLLAEKEIEDDSPLLALRFKERTTGGVVFITKNQNTNIKWKVLYEEHGEPIVVAGVGRYLDLIKFWDWLRSLLEDFINTYGPHDLSTPYLIKKITEYLDEIHQNESRALGIEIIFFTSLLDKLQMLRVKYDGDYHETPLFAIIGGRKKVSVGVPPISLRRFALRELRILYKKQTPNFRKASSLAKKILAKDSKKGTLQILRMDFKKNKPR